MQAVEPPSLMECLRANGEPAMVTSRDRTRAGGHSRGSAPPASSILRALGDFGEASGSLETPYFTGTNTASEQFVAARVGGADEPLRGGGFSCRSWSSAGLAWLEGTNVDEVSRWHTGLGRTLLMQQIKEAFPGSRSGGN